MILYEGNALEVGVTSRLLCCVARIVRLYDRAVIIYILRTPHYPSPHQDYRIPQGDQNYHPPTYPCFLTIFYLALSTYPAGMTDNK
jgi:hypothetical protein